MRSLRCPRTGDRPLRDRAAGSSGAPAPGRAARARPDPDPRPPTHPRGRDLPELQAVELSLLALRVALASKVTRATKLRKSNAAAVRSTRASATWPVVSTACPMFARAGGAPKRRPAPINKAAAKASTVPSTPTWSSPGTRRGTIAGAARMIAAVTARAQRTAGEAEGNALGEQLADKIRPVPRRGRSGWRVRAGARPRREQQAGHVGAGHQQHQAGGRGQHQERRTGTGGRALRATRSRGSRAQSPAAAAAHVRHG